MRNFRTIMVSDANAAPCDEAHLEALVNFYLYYGDVCRRVLMGTHRSRPCTHDHFGHY